MKRLMTDENKIKKIRKEFNNVHRGIEESKVIPQKVVKKRAKETKKLLGQCTFGGDHVQF